MAAISVDVIEDNLSHQLLSLKDKEIIASFIGDISVHICINYFFAKGFCCAGIVNDFCVGLAQGLPVQVFVLALKQAQAKPFPIQYQILHFHHSHKLTQTMYRIFLFSATTFTAKLSCPRSHSGHLSHIVTGGKEWFTWRARQLY